MWRKNSGQNWCDIRACTAFLLGLAVLILVTPTVASASAYTFTDLYSTNSNLNVRAISGTQVVGYNPFHHAAVFLTGGNTDLHPSMITGTRSEALATDGTNQVGFLSGIQSEAYLWSGSATSAVDLNPASGFSGSSASGVRNGQQVGNGTFTATNSHHALLWSGTAASFVDLHPMIPAVIASYALGTDGSHQVGYATYDFNGNNPDHAMLWQGTAASSVDLHPNNLQNILTSLARAVSGDVQVGSGYFAGSINNTHALLWKSTPDSALDLNPTSLGVVTQSNLLATNGIQEVGYGIIGGVQHPLVWSGTADSAVDLNAFLPAGYDGQAHALDIDSAGNIFGWAVSGVAANNPQLHFVEWTVQSPEPSSLGIILFAGASFVLRRHHGRRPAFWSAAVLLNCRV